MIRMTWKRRVGVFAPGRSLTIPGPSCCLVGECGTGKSSLLAAVSGRQPDFADVSIDGRPVVFHHDFESDSPRTRPISSCKTQDDIVTCMAASRLSHGEANLRLIEELKSASNCLILLDEPESGLSPRSCYAFVETCRGAIERGCRFVVATHSPIVALLGKVYCLDDDSLYEPFDWIADKCKMRPI